MNSDRLKAITNSISSSRALAVIALVLVVNIGLLLANPFQKTSPANLPADHSWIYWTSHEFLKETQTPDVVYIGSSLFLHPLTMLDAHYLKKPIDYVDHHHSVYTEDKISERLGTKGLSCFNFSMPGGLVSDDWIIFETLLKERCKPRVVVLGLSVRDFIDNKVRCPGNTPTFKYLSRLVDMEPMLDLALPKLTDRTDYIVSKVAYLWGNKPNVQSMLAEQARKAFAAGGTSGGGSRFSDEELEKLLTMNIDSQLERGWMVEPPDREREFSDNTQEYLGRYRTRHDDLFRLEKQFFDKLLASAKQSGVQVVVVNMPLTPLNVKLMPPGIYAEYLNTLASTTNKYGFTFADLNDGKFSSNLFYDTAHMNSVGGQRLVDTIIDVLVKDEMCLTRLKEQKDTGIASGGNAI